MQKRLDGLDSHNMTKGLGGKVMGPTLIERKDGFLGRFHDENTPGMGRIGL